MTKFTNIDKGPRGLNTTQGKVWVEPGETVDVELAKGEDAPESWFKSDGAGKAKAKAKAKEGEAGLKAEHHGGGKFNVTEGEAVHLSGLSKEDADAFNAMSEEDKRSYVDAEKAKG